MTKLLKELYVLKKIPDNAKYNGILKSDKKISTLVWLRRKSA